MDIEQITGTDEQHEAYQQLKVRWGDKCGKPTTSLFDSCWMVKVDGFGGDMWIGIESDGYTHS